MYRFSLCLSDLPKEKMKRPDNGKVYITLVLDDKREKDQFGNDTVVWVDKSKEEREAGVKTLYVGNGKKVVFSDPVNAEKLNDLPPADLMKDDLPY